MAANEALPDYYAVLQVHPDADAEVIEAAYRQLMKKHHPDVAGSDPVRVAAHHNRSKAINQAFSVLRDPERRRRYDQARELRGTQRPVEGGPAAPRSSRPSAASPPRQPASGPPPRWSNSPPPPRWSNSPPPPSSSTAAPRWSTAPPSHASAAAPPTPPPPTGAPTAPPAEPVIVLDPWELEPRSPWLAPFTAIAAAYYLLPGAYEWEEGRRRELLAVLLVPLLGIASFLLATGRLAPLIGHSLNATLLAAGVIMLAALPLWNTLPRIAMAVVPSVALMSGLLNSVIDQAHVPIWIAWAAVSALSLILSPRLYVFAILPALGACLVITRVL